MNLLGRPGESEAAPYYFKYIEQVAGEDPLSAMQQQWAVASEELSRISETDSLYRYAEDKWSIKSVLNHISDAERVFASRIFWFARGFDDPLPSFDQGRAAAHAEADRVSWAAHIEEFRNVRSATISLLVNLPEPAWSRTGTASGNIFSVRALAYIITGHFNHHFRVLRERYLSQ